MKFVLLVEGQTEKGGRKRGKKTGHRTLVIIYDVPLYDLNK